MYRLIVTDEGWPNFCTPLYVLFISKPHRFFFYQRQDNFQQNYIKEKQNAKIKESVLIKSNYIITLF